MSETPTIESLASRLEDLKHFHINTLDTIDTWLGGFSILIAIVVAMAGYLIINQRKEIKDLQTKGLAEIKKEMEKEMEKEKEEIKGIAESMFVEARAMQDIANKTDEQSESFPIAKPATQSKKSKGKKPKS